ncbi:MAG: peptidoglycan DD-metalloendopeptidase family protein [Bacteroidota bacterium]|nr:peptidoglycan DD-metalloendopeptidase family protein [Bacteroidota bacterium]
MTKCRSVLTRLAELPLAVGIGIILILQLVVAPSITEGMRVEPEIRLDQYGVDVNLYHRVPRVIRRGETLASIMLDEGVHATRIQQAAAGAAGVMDLRRMRSGDPIFIYSGNSRQNPPEVFVYKPSPEKYVTLDFRDSVSVYVGYLPVKKVRRMVSVTVQSDMYSSLSRVESPGAMSMELVRLFGWRVSFQHLQAGDQLSVVYEDLIVDSMVVDLKVVAARIKHRGHDHFAFRYVQEGEEDYFDEQGRSVRGQFLRAPVDYTRISSRYSLRRFHPVQRRYKAHLGTDFAAPRDTPVYSTAEGAVTRAAYGKNNGRYVRIRHGETYQTAYLHLSRIASDIRPGTRVQQGQVIGYVGSTGLATGPHVCYRFWIDGVQVDPLRLTFSAVEALPESELPRFHAMRDSLKQALMFAPPQRPGHL